MGVFEEVRIELPSNTGGGPVGVLRLGLRPKTVRDGGEALVGPRISLGGRLLLLRAGSAQRPVRSFRLAAVAGGGNKMESIRTLILEYVDGDGARYIQAAYVEVLARRPGTPEHRIRARLSEAVTNRSCGCLSPCHSGATLSPINCPCCNNPNPLWLLRGNTVACNAAHRLVIKPVPL
jgi:hypothetical protein